MTLGNATTQSQSTTDAVIFIRKIAGQRKDAVRVSAETDIPSFLFGTIVIDPFSRELILTCVEGTERCPLGSVIGYEETEKTPTGWNAWHIANAADSLEEVDGVFYKKAIVYRAQKIGEEYPSFLEGANIWRNEDGSWSIRTDWGTSTGFPGDAYWVRYGTKDDGTPDANILTKSERSFADYIVCEEDGMYICTLPDWDQK